MYQKIDLRTLTPVGEPGPLPPQLDGLAVDTLLDLAVLADQLPDLAGFGYWPVEAVDGETPAIALDPARRVVVATLPRPAEQRNAEILGAIAELELCQARAVREMLLGLGDGNAHTRLASIDDQISALRLRLT